MDVELDRRHTLDDKLTRGIRGRTLAVMQHNIDIAAPSINTDRLVSDRLAAEHELPFDASPGLEPHR